MDWVELNLKQARKTVIGSIYRAPDGNVVDGIHELEKCLEKIANPALDMVILGDMNIDLIKNNAQTKTLNNFFKKSMLEQVITGATRVTSKSMSLIDHIYINNNNLYSHRGSLDCGLSDHEMIFITRKYTKPTNVKETKYVRNYRNFDAQCFANDVMKINWGGNRTDN